MNQAQRIVINNKDLGFFTETPITVQRFTAYSNCCAAPFIGESDICSDCKEHAGPDLVWCNHAQAEEEEVQSQINRIGQPDAVWTDKVLTCKCGAYKHEGDDYWQDAPFEGVR